MKRLLPVAIWNVLAATAVAQAPLPVVDLDRGEWDRLSQHCQRLVQTAQRIPILPSKSVHSLSALLEKPPSNAGAAILSLQKLLDPYCLIGVQINPESRVKVARGPAAARLQRGHDTFALVKVNNEAGVTAGLGISGPQVLAGNSALEGRWLEAEVVGQAPLSPRLLGQRLEYVVLRLRPHDAGKREATLKFDVGQGSQDLGFRAEVPVLFQVLDISDKK